MYFTGDLLIPNAFMATACSNFLVNMRKLSKNAAAILTDVFSSAHYCNYHHFLLLSTFMQPTWNVPVCSRSHAQILAIGAASLMLRYQPPSHEGWSRKNTCTHNKEHKHKQFFQMLTHLTQW